MASKWEIQELGELCTVKGRIGWRGYTVEDLRDSGPIVLGAKDITTSHKLDLSKATFLSREKYEESPEIQVSVNDILIVKVGNTIGKVAIVLEDIGEACINPNTVLLKNASVNPRYLYYFLISEAGQHYLQAHSTASAQPAINQSEIRAMPIPVPPRKEQDSISHLLGTLDDKIELNRQLNATLEQLARTLFQSWFVDFDPVRAKASGEPEESICRRLGLTPELLALFPAVLEESVMGEVPAGWKVKPFTDFIEILGGGTPKTSVSEYWNGIIPWFSVVDAPSETDIFAINTEKKISQAGLDNSSTRLLPQYTTIISARGTVGRLALIGCPMTMNQSCYGIVGRGFGPFFTYFATRELLNVLKKSSHGTVFDTITRDTFYSVRLPMPPKTVAVAFENTIRDLLQRVQQNCEESRTLGNLRDELLPKLLSGELRISHDYDEAATGRV